MTVRPLTIGSQWLHVFCKKCKQHGMIETLCNVPIRVWAFHMKTLHCEHCHASYRFLMLGSGAAGAAGAANPAIVEGTNT